MSRRSFRRIFFPLFAALLLAGCAGSTKVVEGGGQSIRELLGAPYNGPKARVVVGRIIDHSSNAGTKSLAYQLGHLQKEQSVDTEAVVDGIRDMLTSAMFNTGRFIMLDREMLDTALVEQEFMAHHEMGSLSFLPTATLEGADLLVVGALTSYDDGTNGGIAFPIPIPLSDHYTDFAVVDVEMHTAAASIDIRVIDVRTGRVISTVAVEGKARKFGAALTGVYSLNGDSVRLPGILSVFENTPVENALRDMVQEAAHNIASKTPEIWVGRSLAAPPSQNTTGRMDRVSGGSMN